MFGIGPMELVLILVVALLVFGPKRLPELARTLGRGLGEFRRATNDLRQSLALDDLQRDLRQGRSVDQTIHRPSDRPAQAGDDPPSLDKTTSVAAPDASTSGERGELPVGNDPSHHELDDEAPESSPEAAAKTPATPADAGLGNVPISDTKTPDRKRG